MALSAVSPQRDTLSGERPGTVLHCEFREHSTACPLAPRKTQLPPHLAFSNRSRSHRRPVVALEADWTLIGIGQHFLVINVLSESWRERPGLTRTG